MHARLKGINTIKRTLATGEKVTYYYLRANGTRLSGAPGSPEFLASIAKAEASMRNRTTGTLSGLIREFEKTAKWRRLAESTKGDGLRISLRQGKARRGDREGRLITIRCTKALQATLDALPKRSTLILTTKTGRAFKKRYFAEQWEKTCKAANITDLHFHDIRGTTVTMLFQAGCNLGEIVSITGHSLRRAQEILDRYLARTSTMADNAIAKFENVLETDFAKRPANQKVQTDAK